MVSQQLPPRGSPLFSEAHYAAIVENSFDAIVSKDLDGTIQSWNRAAERIFGWKAEEIVGRSIRMLIPADRQHEEDHILQRIRAGEMVEKFETMRLHRDGTLIPVAVTVSPILNEAGEIVGASKIAHDITEHLHVRGRLEESERLFRSMANNISQLAWIADERGSILWYNDRWYDYTGTTPDEMRGWGWTKVQHPDHVDRVVDRIQQSWDSGEDWEDTFPLRGADGDYRWFLSRAQPIRDENGRIWRWFGTNTDITQQRAHEEQIRLLMGEVNHRAKNMLAVVQALVSRTVDREYADNLSRRLQALAANQDLLTRRNWFGAPVGELVRSQLAAVEDLIGSRIMLEGDDDLILAPSAAETIGLAIHELATNAAKYGALSGGTGQVIISWAILPESDQVEARFRLEWREEGGPKVKAPSRRGFGMIMVEQNPRLSLGAEVETGYPPEGFHWLMTAPLARVRAA